MYYRNDYRTNDKGATMTLTICDKCRKPLKSGFYWKVKYAGWYIKGLINGSETIYELCDKCHKEVKVFIEGVNDDVNR